MTPGAVIDRGLPGQPADPFLRVLERHRVNPFPAQSLDKTLSLAAGAWRVGSGTDVHETKGAVSLGKAAKDLGRAVVRHHLPALNGLAVEPADRQAQKADCRALLLVR